MRNTWILLMLVGGLGLMGCRPAPVTTDTATEDGPSRYQLQRENEQLKQQVEDLKNKTQIAESRMASVEKRNGRLEDKLNELRREIKQQVELISHLQSIPDYRKQAREAQLENIRLRSELQKTKMELDLLKQKQAVQTP